MRLLLSLLVLSLLPTQAHAQTGGRYLEGAKTYFLDIGVTANGCPVDEDFVRNKITFPLSYSALIEGDNNSDIWLDVYLFLDTLKGSEVTCYGHMEIRANHLTFGVKIPFNETSRYSEIQLFRSRSIFSGYSREDIGNRVEEIMKEFVTDYNMDNK